MTEPTKPSTGDIDVSAPSGDAPIVPLTDKEIPAFLRPGSSAPTRSPHIASSATPRANASATPAAKTNVVRRPADEQAATKAVIAATVPTEDELSAVLKQVLPEDEFKLSWLDRLPKWVLKVSGKEKGAILSTFSTQRRGHSMLMGGDDAIEKAVELGLDDPENGAIAFKGIRSLVVAPTITPSTNPQTFKVLMSGTGRLGIAHPATLAEPSAMTLVQQMYKRKIADQLLLSGMLADLGELGARNEGAAKFAWPALKDRYQNGTIKGEGVPKFLGSSGAMADKWESVRSDILPLLQQETLKFATAADKGFLKAAFEAVKAGLNHDPQAGVEFCFEVQNATRNVADFPNELLEDAAIHFVRPLVDARNLMQVFDRQSRGAADKPFEARAIRNLLERVDASGILAHRSRTSLVQAFDEVWIAHTFNQQSRVDIDATDFETDHAIRAIDQKRDTVLSITSAVIQSAERMREEASANADNDKYDTLDWRNLRVARLAEEIEERTEATVAAQADLFQPNI